MSNPTAHDIRAARDVAEGKILDAVREFESACGCAVRDVEIVRVCSGPIASISTPVVMLDVDIGPTRARGLSPQ